MVDAMDGDLKQAAQGQSAAGLPCAVLGSGVAKMSSLGQKGILDGRKPLQKGFVVCREVELT